MSTPTTTASPPVGAPGRWWRRRWLRWTLVALLVVGLVVLAAARVNSAVGSQADGDPRSATADGSAALAAILSAQGVDVERADSSAEAADLLAVSARATLVIVHPDRLGTADVQRLRGASPARLVLVAPGSGALQAFGTGVQAGTAPVADTLAPGCTDPLALRAGTLAVDPTVVGLLPPSPAAGCYRDASGSARYVRIGTATGQIDLVADGFANTRMAAEGNAAFAAGLLGSQPRLVWLMTPLPQASGPSEPTLLPDWWLIFLAQAGIGVVVLALWRGRRLGPIMIEPLPVVVRASETVEGHGRLYQRIRARDRAAEALRQACIGRLGPRFGTTTDPHRLAELLAARTGSDVGRLDRLLAGAAPQSDDELNQLAHDLDQLEQEARQL